MPSLLFAGTATVTPNACNGCDACNADRSKGYRRMLEQHGGLSNVSVTKNGADYTVTAEGTDEAVKQAARSRLTNVTVTFAGSRLDQTA